jgi:hypothetical protein
MDIKTLFKSTIVIGTVAYIAFFFLPYSYGYLDYELGNLLAYSGYGALIEQNTIFTYALFVAWIAVAVGIFLFISIARTAFLFLVIFSTALSPLFGAQVETAGGATLLAIANIADGAVLAMAYLSPLKNEFK